MTEILIGILVLIYGLMFYIVGRTNFLEAVIIRKLQEILGAIDEADETIELQENDTKKQEDIKDIYDCSNCNRKNKDDDVCETCVSSYDYHTNKTSMPSHWQPIPETKKGSDDERN